MVTKDLERTQDGKSGVVLMVGGSDSGKIRDVGVGDMPLVVIDTCRDHAQNRSSKAKDIRRLS